MANFGLSPGDFYFVVTLVGSVVQSFRNGPQGASQQYSAFSAELKLVSKYLDKLPATETELVTLWKRTKAQCVDFTNKYALLDEKARVENGERQPWDWLCRQTLVVFDKVRWPLDGRKDAAELQQNVTRIVQIASMNLGLENQSSLGRLEESLRQVLDGHVEFCKELDEKLGYIQDDVRELNPIFRSKGAGLWQKIEEIRIHPRTIAMMRETALSSQSRLKESTPENRTESSNSSTTDLSLPFASFSRPPKLDEFNFNMAVDHLSRLTFIMDNHIMRLHGGLPPSASSIIAFINHMCQTINIALVGIGKKRQEFEYPLEQLEAEDTLKKALDDWDRFAENAKFQCTRASPPNITTRPRRRSPIRLENIDEDSSPLNYVPPPTRYNIPAYRPWGFARIILHNSSGKEFKWSKRLERCTVTVSHPKFMSDDSVIVFEGGKGSIKAQHHIFKYPVRAELDPKLDSLSGKDSIPMLDLQSSHETLRIVPKDHLPLHNHPKREPVYVLQNEEECLALQTEVLNLTIKNRRVVFSAEVQHIANSSNHHKSCIMKTIRIVQDGDGSNSVFYWADTCPITNQKNYFDFVEFRRSEFKSVSTKDNILAILKFADETTEYKEEKKLRPSIFRRRTSSTDDVRRKSSSDLSRSPTSISTSTFSSSPPSPGIISKDTGFSTFSTLTATTQATTVTTSSIASDPRAKAKKSIRALEITFYSQKGRDSFIKRFENPLEVAVSPDQSIDSNTQIGQQSRTSSFGQRSGSTGSRTSK